MEPKRKRIVVARPSGNACHTCRARRIKCDETRPFCLKCVKSRRQCLGYRATTVAVDIEPSPESSTSPRHGFSIAVGNTGPAGNKQQIGECSPWTGIWDGFAPSAFSKINIRSLEQLQILSNVLEHHYPSDRSEATIARAGSFIARLPAVDLSSFMVSNAVDSLIFAHIASQTKDSLFKIASRISYGKVLRALAQEIANPRAVVRSRATLYSIMVISLYDEAIPQEHRPYNDWETHYWGIHEYLERVGPSALDFQNEFDRILYLNLRAPLLFLALARRKPLVFARSEWLQATIFPEHALIYKSAHTDWYRIASPLAGLLGQADWLLSWMWHKKDPVASLTMVFRRIDNVCEELMAWLMGEIHKHKPQRVAVKDRSAFDTTIEEHRFLTTSDVIQDFLDYRITTMMTRASLVWLHCLIATCTMLRFFNLPQFSESQDSHMRQTVEARAFRYATDLCRTVYSLSKLSSVANAHYVCVMLQIVHRFFIEFSAVREADWCLACLAATRRRIKRKEQTEPPTMCRIANLAGSASALVTSVRYQPGWRQ